MESRVTDVQYRLILPAAMQGTGRYDFPTWTLTQHMTPHVLTLRIPKWTTVFVGLSNKTVRKS